MEACCADGHQMATQHRDCSLPYASESQQCRCVCGGRAGQGVSPQREVGEEGAVCAPPTWAVRGAVGREPSLFRPHGPQIVL